MDPLSVTASILTIIGLADKIISACKGYISAVREAPNDLSSILIEVGSVKCVLEVLEMRSDNILIGNKLRGPDGPFEGTKQALLAFERLLPVTVDGYLDGKRRKLSTSYATLAWPFKEGKAQKLLGDIARHKATISLALTTHTAYASGSFSLP